jgi:AcrR family transcriptional regulator
MTAATELVAEVGWGSVTTRAVAAKAGVNPGVVHYHFSSIPTLLREATLDAAYHVFVQPFDLLEQMDDLGDGLRLMTTAANAIDPSDTSGLFLYEAFLAAARDDEMRRAFAEMLDDVRTRLARWLDRVAHVEDPAGTAAVLAAVLDGYILHRTIDDGVEMRPETLHRMIERS